MVSKIPPQINCDCCQVSWRKALPEQAFLFHGVGILSHIWRHRQGVQNRTRFRIPLFHRLPLVDFGIAPPTPFWNETLDADRSWKGWLCRYNAAASQATKLEGEWIGIYEWQHGAYYVDPMMENIHFHPGPGDRTAGETVEISAKGCFDFVGPFGLQGTIDQHGRFDMVKRYTMGTYWHWDGAMTPFGFVGLWQRPHSTQRGLFWLYKRSWCEESEQGYVNIPTSQVDVEPYPEEPEGWDIDDYTATQRLNSMWAFNDDYSEDEDLSDDYSGDEGSENDEGEDEDEDEDG